MSFDENGNVVFLSASTGEVKTGVTRAVTPENVTPWHNQAFLYAGVKELTKHGAKLFDISGRIVLDEANDTNENSIKKNKSDDEDED